MKIKQILKIFLTPFKPFVDRLFVPFYFLRRVPFSLGYNTVKWRSISKALNDYKLVSDFSNRIIPSKFGIGIDESTALIVRNKEIEIAGESEVIVVQKPKGITKSKKENLVSIKRLEMAVYTEGQKFKIK